MFPEPTDAFPIGVNARRIGVKWSQFGLLDS
jgi:hypothetical protein